MPISQTEFDAIKTHAQELEAADGTRNTLFDAMDDMYLMTATDLPTAEWIKETISPDARNAEDGAFRLMASTDPVWKVPRETNDPGLRKMTDKLERAARSMWDQAGKVALRPRHYDIIRSAIHYGEIHVAVESLKARVETLKPGSGGRKKAEAAQRRTPVLFEVINPRDGHPQWGDMGLIAYYSKRLLTVADIRARFGDDKQAGKKTTDQVITHDYWSLDWHIIWADGEKDPYVAEPNEDGIIPIVAVICEGGFLFNQPDQDTRQPFLYTLYKSNVWNRQNLFLTVMNSLVFTLGSKPLLVYETTSEDGMLHVDRREPGGVVVVHQGEKLYALMEKVLDPTLIQQKQIMDQLAEQSTIYKTALGQSLGANAPFSMVSLLSQQGRLPLMMYQRMASWAIAEAMRLAFAITKRDGGGIKTSGKTGLQEIKASDIPEEFDIEAQLEVSMPQDDRMNATVASQGLQAGLWSKRYARETFVGIGQSSDMEEEIWEERFADMQAQLQLQQQQQQAMMALQQQMQAQQMPPGGAPGQGMPPGMDQAGPQGIPPEMMDPSGMGMPAAQQGLPQMGPSQPMGIPEGPGGLPPDMMGGGYG